MDFPLQHVLFILLSCLIVSAASAAEWRGFVGAEYRVFFKSALDSDQHTGYASVLIEPEFYHGWKNERHAITIKPFFRLDQHDDDRTHADLREFFWLYAGNDYEVAAGVRKVFWGVTESQHLVDIINQTDLVENPDGEEKLGQPMLNATLLNTWGNIELYVLPYFRERTFPGEEGRLRTVPRVDTEEDALYESGRERQHLDWAARWSHSYDGWDVGISHFYGTGRDPLLLSAVNKDGEAVLLPFYALIHQTGIDVQGAAGAWLWKLEAIYRDSRDDDFAAMTGGFEYTFYNVYKSGLDIGLVTEYLYDDRGKEASTAFADDIMLGLRLTPNDVQSTEVLASVVFDRDTDARIYSLEASRRLTDHIKISLEGRAFHGMEGSDPFYSFRKDDFIQLTTAYFF